MGRNMIKSRNRSRSRSRSRTLAALLGMFALQCRMCSWSSLTVGTQPVWSHRDKTPGHPEETETDTFTFTLTFPITDTDTDTHT